MRDVGRHRPSDCGRLGTLALHGFASGSQSVEVCGERRRSLSGLAQARRSLRCRPSRCASQLRLREACIATLARRAFVHETRFRVVAFVGCRLRLAAQWRHRQVDTLMVACRVPPLAAPSIAAATGTLEAPPNPALKRTRRERASLGLGGVRPFAALVARLPARRLALR
jgi:hypothetical protein